MPTPQKLTIDVWFDKKRDNAGWSYVNGTPRVDTALIGTGCAIKIRCESAMERYDVTTEEHVNLHFPIRAALGNFVEKINYLQLAWRAEETTRELQALTADVLNRIEGRPKWLVDWHRETHRAPQCLTTYPYDDLAENAKLRIIDGRVVLSHPELGYDDCDPELAARIDEIRDYQKVVSDFIKCVRRRYRKQQKRTKVE